MPALIRLFRVSPAALRARRSAFTLVEILVVIALLSIIVLGLLAMFGQTQRAFRTGMTQTDVLAAGRAGADMIARELEQTTPANGRAVNFFVAVPNTYQPLLQGLPGTNNPNRANVLENLYFLTRQNLTWSGIGYLVDTPNQGVGTLYRYFATTDGDPTGLFNNGRNGFYDRTVSSPPAAAGLSRIMDGVVHFRLRAFDTNSVWINPDMDRFNRESYRIRTNATWSGSEVNYTFTSNAVPAFVELEIGVLEDRTYERYRSIPNAAAARTYLSNHVGQVHLFRQRVSIRNVELSAYQ